MSTEIPMAVPVPGETGLIAFDLECTSCGYNLRGLQEGGVCPECAQSIAHSLRGDRLVYSSPEWLMRIRFGATLMLWYILLNIMTSILVLILGGAGLVEGPLIILPSLVVEALFVISVFMLTAREPKAGLHNDPSLLRNTVRISAGLAFLTECVMLASSIFEQHIIVIICVVGTRLGALVAILAVLLLLSRLILRIPDAKLAKSTRTVMWGFIIGPALYVVSAFLIGAVGANSSFTNIAQGLTVAASVMLLIVTIMYVFVLFRSRRALWATAQSARAMADQQRESTEDAKI